MRCSLISLGVRFFSAILVLSSCSSLRMILSSSCLDLVSPMFLMSSLSFFERCAEELAMLPNYNSYYSYHSTLNIHPAVPSINFSLLVMLFDILILKRNE